MTFKIRITRTSVTHTAVVVAVVAAAIGGWWYVNRPTSEAVAPDAATIGVPVSVPAPAHHWVVAASPAAAATLASRLDVRSVSSLGDGTYAVAGDIDAATVAALTGSVPTAEGVRP